MSKIRLKSLLNVTEQAPQPSPGATSPVPLQTAPSSSPAPEENPDAKTTPTSAQPEDPSEYDFTRDFRQFEDSKNKAESDAKKELLEKLNERILGKTIEANASRGYGQPKTDYTIKNAKKVSVEFYYKEYVVVVSDENDKKYFLTPGVNIKIVDAGQTPDAASKDQAPQEPETKPEVPQPDAGAQTQPPAVPGADAQPPMDPTQAAAGAAPAAVPGAPVPGAPAAPVANVPGQPPAVPPVSPEEDPEQKKKAVAERFKRESIQKDLSKFLVEFMSKNAFRSTAGIINFIPYIKKVQTTLNEVKDVNYTKCLMEIPVNHMVDKLDIREVQLAANTSIWSGKRFGKQYSKGSVDITKVGRLYLFEFVKEVGWDS